MQATANTYLKYIDLILLENWSVQGLLDAKFNYSNKYEQAKIGDFLIKCRNIVNIEDDKEYNRVTVKIKNNGVILRDTEKGVNIGTKKQYRANAGQFIISKIDARNGAFGIIPSELDNAIVTNDFPLFDVNTKKINPQFLLLITTTKVFIKFAQSCSSGTTNRQRMDIDMFLNQKIPLPELEEQDKIVNNYLNKVNEAERLKIEAEKLEAEIENYFSNQLGVKKDNVLKSAKGLQIFNYSDFERWDVWTNKGNSITEKYKPLKFKDIVIGKPIYGANVKGVKRKSDTRYIRITDINENGTLNEEFVSPEFVEEKYLLKENDFLIARSGNTVGKTFLYKEKYGRAIYAGYLVNYHLDMQKVLPEYVLEYTKSYSFKQWILSNQRIAGQPNINGQEYLESPIIVPPLNIQKSIVEKVSEVKSIIQNINLQIASIKIETEEQFEQTIFNS
jgi:type I restriction enzyme, S subunit